jgi:hypothetical protein
MVIDFVKWLRFTEEIMQIIVIQYTGLSDIYSMSTLNKY